MADLCIDARMAFSSGIGTYIRAVVPLLEGFRRILLVDRLDQSWCREGEQILFPAPIYSLKEQVFFPIKIPKCDLFWSPHYNVPLLPIKAKKRIATIHDACHLTFGSSVEKAYARFVMHRALYRSHQAITVSQFAKSDIQRHLGNRDLEVIPIGVDRKHFIRKPASKALQNKYRLPEKFILFVGCLKPHKNLERLLRAFSKVQKLGLGLVLVGKGTPLGIIPDEELPIFYSMAEMLVFPSLYEGFGLPPLEAMSCGCPTLVSRAASLPEVCGDASVYFDPENEQEIADAIAKVATDGNLKNRLVQRGFERIQQFDWARTAERHRQIFEEVCRA